MLTQQQNTYLETMGVDVYLPRFPLPGAKASLQYAAKALGAGSEVEQLSPSQAAKVQKRSSAAFNELKEVMGAEGKQSQPVAKPNIVATVSETKAVKNTASFQQAAGKFSLSLSVSRYCVIVDSASVDEQQMQTYQQLLHNFVFALEEEPNNAIKQTRFNWPPVQSQQFDQSVAAAKETLAAFLERFFQATDSQAPKFLILMGEIAPRFIDSREGVQSFHTVSLLDALYQPHLKKQIWQDLAQLRVSLSRIGQP